MVDRTASSVARPAIVLGLENFDRLEIVGGLADRGRPEEHDARNFEGRSDMPRARIVRDQQTSSSNQGLQTSQVEDIVEHDGIGFHRISYRLDS